jgi:hypothetical protein
MGGSGLVSAVIWRGRFHPALIGFPGILLKWALSATKPTSSATTGERSKPGIELDWDLGYRAVSALPSGLTQALD